MVLEARKAWMPKCFAPIALSFLNPSMIWGLVKPYLASSWVVHDLEPLFALAQGEHAAGIVAAGDGLGM